MFNESIEKIKEFIEEDFTDIWEELRLFGPYSFTHRYRQREFITDERPWKVVERIHLTDKKQDIIRLYYWDGLTQGEIGIVFRVSQPVISKHITEAKKKILRYIFWVIKEGGNHEQIR